MPTSPAFEPLYWSGLADGFGTLGLFLFALTAWMSPVVNALALGLCVVALALSPEGRRAVAADRFLRFLPWVGVFIVAQSIRGTVMFPETLERQWIDCGKWLLLWSGFLVTGWWLRADPVRIREVLLAAALGLWIALLDHVSLGDLLAFRTGQQTGFQMSAGCSGLISASVVLGLLLFSGRLVRKPCLSVRNFVRVAGWTLGMYLSVFMLIASQSRTAWFGAALVFIAVFGYRYQGSARAQGIPWRRLPYLPLLVGGFILGGAWLNKDTILTRFGQDSAAIAAIAEGKEERLAEVGQSSIKHRYTVQKFGLRKWLEKPLLGWGTGSSGYLIRTTGGKALWDPAAGQQIAHLHSAYLEMLVRFGLLGALLFAYAGRKLVKTLSAAAATRRMPADCRLLFFGCLGLSALWATNVHQVMVQHWQAYWLLLMGVGYTFVLHPARPGESKASAGISADD
jgi:O-antigen ligase